MAELVKDIKRWLNTLPDEWSVGIGDGGLDLVAVEKPSVYYEIGGIPDEKNDEEGEGADDGR